MPRVRRDETPGIDKHDRLSVLDRIDVDRTQTVARQRQRDPVDAGRVRDSTGSSHLSVMP
jgi:hypothetical protein